MADNQPGIRKTLDPSKPWNKPPQGDNVINNQFKPLSRDDIPKKNIQTFRQQTTGMPTPTQAANDDPTQKIEDVAKPQENLLTQINAKLEMQSSAAVMQQIIGRTQLNTLVGISDKLSVLSDRLSEKFSEERTIELISVEPTTTDVLTERDDTTDQQAAPDTHEPLVTTPTSRPSDSLLEEDDANKKKSGKEMESQKDVVQRDGFKMLGGILSTGFKKSTSAFEKVGDFLFKGTLKQAIETAKIAALIFAIIVAVDLLKVAWAMWGEKIMATINDWKETFVGWWESFTSWGSQFSDLTTIFEAMGANLMEIKNAWISGDFPALASAIGGALFDLAKTISATLTRALAGVITPLLRKFGFNDAADSVEAYSLRYQQNMTDSKLSKENQRKLAEDQVKKESDGKTTTERGNTDFLPASWRNKIGLLSDAEYAQVQSEKKDLDAKSGLSHEQKVQNTMATNEAREALARYKKYADAANPENKSDMAKVDKYKAEAQDLLKDGALSLTPETKRELDNQFNSITVKKKAELQPAPAANSQDSQKVKAIQQSDTLLQKQNAIQHSTANVQNNVVNSNRTITMQSPVTSTSAPGIFRATGVN